MAKISTLDLVQINKQLTQIDTLNKQMLNIQKMLDNVGFQAATADPQHAPQTTHNVQFTWTGGSSTCAWTNGIIRSKNASAQQPGKAAVSSAPGALHNWPVSSGSQSLTPSTYYWAGWDPTHNVMLITQDASQIHQNHSMLMLCQFYTGTGGQTGWCGGPNTSSQAGAVDLSGMRYKNF